MLGPGPGPGGCRGRAPRAARDGGDGPRLSPQVGYEPLPPTLGRNIFGRQVYQLPGLFAYGE